MTRLLTKALLFVLAFAAPVVAADPIKVTPVHIRLIQQVEVPALQPALLREVFAKEGQTVEAGTRLAKTNDREAEIELRQARTELAIAARKAQNREDLLTAEEEYAVATRNLQRVERSVAKFEGSVSAIDLDGYRLKRDTAKNAVAKAKSEIELANLNVEVHKHKVALAEARLARHQLLAPFTGIVVDVKQQIGEWVEPGETVLRLLRLDRLRAEGYVAARLAGPSLLGSKVHVSIGEQSFPGKVVFVSPEVDPVSNQVRIYAEVENGDLQLRPGVKATMTVHPR